MSKKWTVFIILQLLENPILNFSNIQNRIKKQSGENLSATVLSGSLSILEEQKIVSRKVISDKMPVRVIYSLTKKGIELGDLLHKIDIWNSKWQEENATEHRKNCELCQRLPELDIEIITEQ